MIKKTYSVGLSRDYIIHPGETLAEIMEDRGITQQELAIKTQTTETYIREILYEQKDVTATFAKKLEYVLGIEASFWMNLQANYMREILQFEKT